MAHFSKFIRPGAAKIGCIINSEEVMVTAVKNPDKSIAIVLFNPTDENKVIELNLTNYKKQFSINAKALQTVVLKH